MFFRTKKTAQTSPTPRVFEIPEILDRIFFFIQEDFVLSHSIVLVCRQWLWMNQHRLRREVSWDSNNKSRSDMINIDRVLARLPRATQLVWSSTDDVLKEKHTHRLIQALQENNNHYIQRLQPNASNNVVVVGDTSNINSKSNRIIGRWKDGLLKPSNKAPLSKGVLCELDLRGPAALFLRVLPFLTSLTTLQLRLLWPETIQVHTVLNNCPHLLTLHLDAPSVIHLPGSWKASTETTLGVEPINENRLLPLQSFILENASFAQTSLEDLLVLTPHLANLQLRNLRPDTTSVNKNSYDWSSLFCQLTALSLLPLRSIHFSVYGQAATEDEEQEKVLVVCPQSSEWAFRSFDLTPSVTSCLNQLRNTLTTLDLVASEGQAVKNYDLALHRYLCASPHLLHLKAANSACLVERMDIHKRWTPSIRVSNGSVVQDLQPGIWACRNLQTLHIRVHNLGSAALQTLPIRSRIVFGYISTVLPQLRHLELFELENDPGLSINLYGGLCLLARLRHLESFRLGTGTTPQRARAGDVRWMIPTGQSRVSRMERKEVVATWGLLMNAERDAERSRQEISPEYAFTDDSHLCTEPQVVERLIMLGLLADVKVLVDQMNSKEGYRSWPKLKYLSVYQKHSSRAITCLEKGFERLMKGNTMDIDSRVNDDTCLIIGYGA